MLQSEKTLQITKSLLLRKGRYLNMQNSEVPPEQDGKQLVADKGEPTLNTLSSPNHINRSSAQNSTLFKEWKGGNKETDDTTKRRFAAT